ncbi:MULTISPECIES: V-type ATPase 116kDa subunit family protein [unclassified Nocardia]|uniref:V-type ATPase 116kDa subunit family protein n=1 Tax=unclassified Nocardia TaxID=2637762 RepID=UPI001CE3F988|nr:MULTISPECIES: V-type ATPase 116kDa subunit family protein [unclassified Nocardia]
MSWSEALTPVRMRRIALVAPADSLRAVLVRVAATGVVQLDRISDTDTVSGTPRLSRTEPDLAELTRTGRTELLAGEHQLRGYLDAAVRRRSVAAVAGWCPETELPALTTLLRPLGAAVVPLATPRGIDPPTLLTENRPLRASFAPLVRIYGTVPYRDIDPTIPAGLAYVAMFGMMFGDAGHGLLLLAAALVLRGGWIRRLTALRRLWVFVACAGGTATVFGLLYGEFFGPTRVLSVLWLDPIDDPVRLMVAAVGVGAALLAFAYGIGTVNRWREGGIRAALYATSGIAGATTFLGLGTTTWGVLAHTIGLLIAGATSTVIGLALSVIGMFTESGGGATGIARSGIGVFDLVLRIGANLVSFARLAAFGMTHAAIGWVIWQAATAVAGRGIAGIVLAAAIFVVGNASAFALEALVAGIQALRLEFYELFSRVFEGTGQPFTPWHIPVDESEHTPC